MRGVIECAVFLQYVLYSTPENPIIHPEKMEPTGPPWNSIIDSGAVEKSAVGSFISVALTVCHAYSTVANMPYRHH
jgi:hypothetical protein